MNVRANSRKTRVNSFDNKEVRFSYYIINMVKTLKDKNNLSIICVIHIRIIFYVLVYLYINITYVYKYLPD